MLIISHFKRKKKPMKNKTYRNETHLKKKTYQQTKNETYK